MGHVSRHLSAVLGLAVFVACGAHAHGSAAAGPVIAIAHDWDAYPTAIVSGRLTLEHGCLLIGGQVVFWPHGTRWDREARSVIQTDGTEAPVGESYKGGGGFYDTDTDFAGLLGSSTAAGRISRCVNSSSTREVLVATPR